MPGMLWAVKPSLIAYVTGLDDGAVETTSPAERRDDGFWFPLASGGAEGSSFSGAVRLSGHWGMLDLEFREPRIVTDGARATLLVRERGRDAYLPLADLTATDASRTRWAATLTGHGALLTGGQYGAGTELAPVLLVGSDD